MEIYRRHFASPSTRALVDHFVHVWIRPLIRYAVRVYMWVTHAQSFARRHTWVFWAALACVSLTGCAPITSIPSATPNSLAPQGPAATRIASLWWLMLGLGAGVWLFVMGLLLMGLFRRRRAPEEGPLPVADDHARTINLWVIGGGIVLPTAVLSIVFGFTVSTMRALAVPAPPNALIIEITGYQFWWQVRYPDQPATTVFTTANEIHIPVGQPVLLRLTSADVIHSFWVPELHGKLDLVPGRFNSLVIQADQAGEFNGICAEFCGIQHAKMAFLVVAQPPDQFAAWLRNQQFPAAMPVDSLAQQGQQVFLSSKCVLCHRVAGTAVAAQVGPDLTHLASRRTLAAATLPNTRGHLAGWLLDPQHIKPGNAMPASQLSPQDLQLLLAYLESLK